MSINIHHGPPGSYKSAGVVQRYMINALLPDDSEGSPYPNGRTVVTNIRGFDSIEKVESAYGVTCGTEASIISLDTETRESLDYAARWFHWAPVGALIVLDEAQAVYPAARRDFKIENLDYPGGPTQAQLDDRPADVLLAFDMHRHYNWDLFLCTPNIGKIHREIRQSSQAAFRHWDIGGLLPWKKGKWKELEHDPESSGKSASHGFGVPKEYKIDKRTFECYQSTKTGKATGAFGRESIFKDTKLRIVLAVIVVCFVGFAWSSFRIIERETSRGESVPLAPESAVPVKPVIGPVDRGQRRDSVNDQNDSPVDHPLADFHFRIAGNLSSSFIFHADAFGDEYSFTSSELTGYGYNFVSLGNCHVEIWYRGEPVSDAYCQPRKIEKPDVRIASFDPVPSSSDTQEPATAR